MTDRRAPFERGRRMVMMNRVRGRLASWKEPVWLLALFCLGGLGACTSSPGGNAGGRGQPGKGEKATTAGGVIPAERVKTCAGFTPETAATLLGVPAAGIVDRSADLYEKLRSCTFLDPKNPSTLLTFSLRRDDSVEEAKEEMVSFRDHLGVARQSLPGAEGSTKEPAVQEISGLGDEALWVRINGTLNVREGNVTIQVSQPGDRDVQKKVAEKVLEGLR
jgi:hypothetical protein